MEKINVCTWKEKANGKGNVYIPSCLGNSSNGVNIFKVCKRYNKSIVGIFKECPFCKNPVVVDSIKETK